MTEENKKKCRIAFGIFEATVDCPESLDPDTDEFKNYFIEKFKKAGMNLTEIVAT